ncbi:hypothetical protein BD626DRAFT_394347 [Schizophyllum amplum]|uniref:DUF676 domain-containing protein n=1 Tax=Schizophyllum amplum TaxID=97359 RepID=A0A550CS77_9AGAR|nr:hypothetical protein BD626DRAFT_394347 [Auriculariopsis ampla]
MSDADPEHGSTVATPPSPTIEEKGKGKQPPKDNILVVFIHGFKGDDETFAHFPDRLQHILSEAISDAVVECVVFPQYETKGNLTEAVNRFSEWLTTKTVEREVATGGGAGNVKIVLAGHSMGGILAADTLQEFIQTRPDPTAPLWPKIVAVVAFDTPYLGVHPFVFKNSATKAVEYASTAKTIGTALLGGFAGFGSKKPEEKSKAPAGLITAPEPASTQSGWARWALPAVYAVGGAVAAGAVAGGAYWRREDLNLGYSWVTDHMKYVGELWNEKRMNERVEGLVDFEEQHNVLFKTFYTYLPPSPPSYFSSRTFVVLPKRTSRAFTRFVSAKNELAIDELEAHTGMFSGTTNDGYYELGLETAKFIRQAVHLHRGTIEAAPPSTESIDSAALPPLAPRVDENNTDEGDAVALPQPPSA